MKMIFNRFVISFFLISIPFLIQAESHGYAGSSNDCIRYIEDHRHIHFLDLRACKLRDSDIPAISSYLEKNPDIEYLYIGQNNMGSEGAKLLAANQTVAVLNLDDNHIGAEGAAAFAENNNLVSLSIRANAIGNAGAIALAKTNRLKNLDVSNNEIDAEGVIALANNDSFHYLNLAGNTLNTEAVDAITNTKSIYALDVSYTDLGFNEVAKLAKITDLSLLAVNGLDLGDRGARMLARHPSLTALYIADNGITLVGVAAIAQLPQLVDLNLGNNAIGDQGIKSLVTKRRYAYWDLDLHDTNLSDKGASTLAGSLTAIGVLNVSHNHLSSVGLKALQESDHIEIVKAEYNTELPYEKDSERVPDRTIISWVKMRYYDTLCTNNNQIACLKLMRFNR